MARPKKTDAEPDNVLVHLTLEEIQLFEYLAEKLVPALIASKDLLTIREAAIYINMKEHQLLKWVDGTTTPPDYFTYYVKPIYTQYGWMIRRCECEILKAKQALKDVKKSKSNVDGTSYKNQYRLLAAAVTNAVKKLKEIRQKELQLSRIKPRFE